MKLRKLIKELRRKLRREQDNLALRLELAALYRDNGNIDDAVATYREVAQACWEAGQLDDAMAACRSALDLAPGDGQLRGLMVDLRRARRGGSAEHGAAGRDGGSRRRAQIWSTEEVQEVAGHALPRGKPEQPDQPGDGHAAEQGAAPAAAGAATALAGAPRSPAPGRARTTGPREVYTSAQADARSSQITLTPTPLPAPLPLHDAVEDSLMAQQPWLRIRSRISGPVPEIPLPGDLAASDDELLALARAADAADAARHHAREDHEEEEDTDVRGMLAAQEPGDADRNSQDLTRPVVRLDTEPPVTSTSPGAQLPHDGPVMVSGEISIDDMGAVTSRRAGRPGGARAGLPGHDVSGPEDLLADELAGEPDRTTEDLIGDAIDDELDETGDETTLIKDLPEPPVLPESGSAVVRAPVEEHESSEMTLPVSVPATARMDAADGDQILAEDALAGPRGSQRITRRRPAARTLMDFTPPVPHAAASMTGRAAAVAEVFPFFPDHVVEALAEQVALRSFSDAEHVFQEGEPGRACFIVAAGTVRLLRRDPVAEGHPLVETMRLGRGALFGEHALLAERRRQGTAQVVGECQVYEIPRRALRELAAVHEALGPLLDIFYRDHLVSRLLDTAPLLRALSPARRNSLRTRFQSVRRVSGEAILRQGERTGGLYVVVLGSVEITQRVGERRARLLATLGEGAYFGDMSTLDGSAVAGATVSAAGPVELAVLSPEQFHAVAVASAPLWDEIRGQGYRRELEQSQLLTGETSML